ncbi:MAG: T9SS type A sorting domain-containing protein [Candidatus Hatepunaea meridiana]|nr:T9SS type A sorting domain-containing protein [Candidatus Hatepunaea meridiana]
MCGIKGFTLLLYCLVFTGLLFVIPNAQADIVIEPVSIEDDVDIPDEAQYVLTVFNEGDDDLIFTVEHEIIDEPERDLGARRLHGTKQGPQRDDPGDVLYTIRTSLAANNYKHLAWDYDNNWMWQHEYMGQRRVVAYDLNGYNPNEGEVNDAPEIVAQWQHPGPNPMDVAYYDGTLYYMCLWNAWVARKDLEGNDIGNLNVNLDGGRVNGVAIDAETGIMYIIHNNAPLHVYVFDLENDGERVARLGGNGLFPAIGNDWCRSMDYVAKHPDGPLWVGSRNRLHQFAVNTDEWVLGDRIANFARLAAQQHDGFAHDGYNLWSCNYSTNIIQVIDDGITETYWLMYEPDEGRIEADDEMEIGITVTTEGLLEGAYEADLIFMSNDPEFEAGLRISFVINTIGAANIGEITWEAGHPDVINFNAEFDPDLFTGGPYRIPITIGNNGSRALEISDIASDEDNDPVFTAEPTELEIAPYGEGVVELIFNASLDSPDEYESNMIIYSNDHNEEDEEYEIAVRANVNRPPIISVEPLEIEDDLITAEQSDHEIVINNEGESLLWFTTEFVIVSEPDDERGYIGPRRDDVDLEDMRFAVFQDRSSWGWLDDLMLGREPLVDGEMYDSYRNANDWNDVDFEEYDVIIMSTYNQGFVQQYNNNLERFSEYIADGGCLYAESGNSNAAIRTPGGIYNDNGAGDGNGALVVSPDPNDDNYSLLAYICHETQPDHWDEGEVIEGGSWLHASYNLPQFENGVDNGTLEWYQVIANTQNGGRAGAVVYGYGRGTVLTVAHPVGHCWQNYNQPGMWGSIAAEILYYLTEAGSSGWVSVDPAEGQIEPDGDAVTIILTIDATGLFEGEYEAELHIPSNDPTDSDVVVAISFHISPASDLVIRWEIGMGETGYADEESTLDWNAYYDPDFYVNTEYELEATLKNEGTSPIEISSVSSSEEGEDPHFYSDIERAFVLEAGEEAVVILYFTSDDAEEYPGEDEELFMVFTSDDPDEEEIAIPVHAFPKEPPIIGVDPDEVSDELFTGDIEDYEINISNNGVSTLRFKTEIEIIQEPEGRDDNARTLSVVSGVNTRHNISRIEGSIGPRRDDPGEIIAQIPWQQAPVGRYKGCTYDQENEWMWFSTYSPNWLGAVSFDEDYEDIEVAVQPFQPQGQNPMNIAWMDGVIYVVPWANSWLGRWDTERNNLGNLNLPSRPTALTTSPENGWLITISDLDWDNLYFFEVDDNRVEEVGRVNWRQGQFANQNCRGIGWVDAHPDGQLWINIPMRIHQLKIDTEEWQIEEFVQDFAFDNGNNQWVGITHDGSNLWLGSYNQANFLVVDDGITERRWLMWDPNQGELESDQDLNMIVTLDASGLPGGDYIADLHILSNDPENDDISISVWMSITGVPNIDVTPGGDEEDEQPLDFGVVYIDYPQTRNFTIENTGTDDLQVDDVQLEDGSPYWIDGDIFEIILEPEEVIEVEITFNPEDANQRYEEVIRFLSNDLRYPWNPDEDQYGYPVRVDGLGLEAPVLVFMNAIEEEIGVGEEVRVAVELANEGGSELVFETEIEIISIPERDRNRNRSLRRVKNNSRSDTPVACDGVKDISRSDTLVACFDYPSPELETSTDKNVYPTRRVAAGPRRDDLEDYVFALFQDQQGWGWFDDNFFSDAQGLGNVEYTWFRNADDWNNVDFVDYDALIITGNFQSQAYYNAYNQNANAIEEYILNGGAMYFETGYNDNQPMRAPGGVEWVYQPDNDGRVKVSQDPDDDNYFLLAELMNWNDGDQLRGGSFTHNRYDEAQFRELDDSNWYQVIAEGWNNRTPAIVAYNLGIGVVVVSGCPVGHQWQNWAQPPNWGSTAEELLIYLTSVSGAHWISIDPEIGEMEAGADMDIFVILNTEQLTDGLYEADVHFLSNDPESPDQVMTVNMLVVGQVLLDEENTNPLPAELGGDPIEFNPTYINGEEEDMTTIVLVNAGSDELEFDRISLNNEDEFSIAFDDDVVVPAFDSIELDLLFHPVQVGERNGAIYFFSNAENESFNQGRFHYELSGMGQIPPRVSTEPDDGDGFSIRMLPGDDPLEETVIIHNAIGNFRRDLIFDVDIEIVEEERDTPVRRLRSVNRTHSPRRDELWDEISILLLKSDADRGYGWADNNEWLAVFENQQPEVVQRNIEDIDDINLEEYDLVCTGEDLSEAFFQQYTDHRNQIIDYVNDGGLFVFFAGSNSFQEIDLFSNDGDILVRRGPHGDWGDVNPDFLNDDQDGLIEGIEEDLPLFTPFEFYSNDNDDRNRQRVVMRGSSLNYAIINQADLPEDAVWYYKPQQQDNTCIIADWQCGSGYVLFTGITGTLFWRQDWQWSSMMECTNLTRWAEAKMKPCWITADPDQGSIPAGEEEEVILTIDPTELENFTDYNADVIISSNDPDNEHISIRVTLELGSRLHNPDFVETDYRHELQIDEFYFNDEAVPSGWEISVFTDGNIMAGGVVWQDRGVRLIAYGDVPGNEQVDGFYNGETFNFRTWDPETDEEYSADAEFINGPRIWVNDGFSELVISSYSLREQVIQLLENWNMISLNIIPNRDYWDNEDVSMRLMCEEFDDLLMIAKNMDGDFCIPEWNYWGIRHWNPEQGYLVRVEDEMEVSWEGAPIHPQADIHLGAGWNMIAYYPDYDLLASRGSGYYVLSSIIDHVLIAKDGNGGFMGPGYFFSDMDPWTPGQGYMVLVDADVVLNYPVQPDEGDRVPVGRTLLSDDNRLNCHWQPPAPTGVNMSVLINLPSSGGAGVPACENSSQVNNEAKDFIIPSIAAFNSSGNLVGAGIVKDYKCGLAVWGSVGRTLLSDKNVYRTLLSDQDVSQKTDILEGMQNGESFELRYWDAENNTEVELIVSKIKAGDGLVYSDDGFTVLDVTINTNIPTEFNLSQNYPNPFNAITRIAYSLPEAVKVSIRIYDVTGRQVTTLIDHEQQAGRYNAVWDAGSVTSGIYIIRMEAGKYKGECKAMVVK